MTIDREFIESARRDALVEGLSNAVQTTLRGARINVEQASNDGFQNFTARVLAARKRLDEAEALYNEWFAL